MKVVWTERAWERLTEIVIDRYRIVYRRMPHTIEVLTVFEGHRLLRRGELPENA
jgi:hypothetical protein